MTARRALATLVFAALASASPAAQWKRVALDAVAAADAGVESEIPRNAGVWLDLFGAVRIADGLDLVARPVITRRAFDGVWQKQIYQLGARYERPGRIGLRLEAGQMPSPIGMGLLENRPDLNPVVSQHSAYYLPLPRIDPEIPRTFLVAAAYPLGAQATVSGRAWDARIALLDSSPVRGRPFFGSNKPPRMANTVVGAGFRPHFGVRLGAAVAHGSYVAGKELPGAGQSDRDATMVQVEGEWSFGYTRIAGELVRSVMETGRADAVAQGGWIEATQTLTPRFFIAGRADVQRFVFQPPVGTVDGEDYYGPQRPLGASGRERYYRYEAIAGFRLTPDLTLRGGYLVRKGYVVFHWDDQAVVSIVWQRKIS